MKFKAQLFYSCLLGLFLGASISAAKADSIEDVLPSVICKDNRIYVVFTQQKFYMKVNNIFCSYHEDLVKL